MLIVPPVSSSDTQDCFKDWDVLRHHTTFRLTPRSVTPVVSPPRNQPAAIRERCKETLDEMEATGVIRKVDEPTEWVNSLVVIEKPKSKKLRICLDPRPLNTAICREHFQLPTLEYVTTRLTGARVFSKLMPSMDIGKFHYQRAVSYSQPSIVLLGVTVSNACPLG